MRWYSYIFILGLWMVSGCSKECSWNYDRLHDKWIYECDPKAPEPIVYPTLVQGTYAVKSFKIEYIPNYKHASFYKKWVDESFKNFADNIQEIRIEKQYLESNYAEVYGVPRASIRSANHSNVGISFNTQSSYRMPSNVNMGTCFEGLTVKGSIDLHNGKPISGWLEYMCAEETIISYTFDF